jgi:Tol biopolymer transport system component
MSLTFARRASLAIALVAAMLAMGASPTSATYRDHNGLIVFSALTADWEQIYVMRPDGTHLRQITHSEGADAVRQDWSPDGRWIVFAFENDDGCRLAKIHPDGSDLTDLSHGRGGCESQPSFTPDGEHLVFERYDPVIDVDALYRSDADGRHLHRILVVPATDPNVSPDGRTVSFVEYADGDFRQALSIVRMDGTHYRRLTPFRTDVAIKQDWAPDGRHLVFSDNADVPDKAANVATIRPNGTCLHYLTHNTAIGHGAYAGSYSPNGRWIIYRQEADGLYSLMRMRPDGSHKTQILPLSTFRPRSIDWGPRPSGDSPPSVDGSK